LLSVLHAGAERCSDELVPDDMIRYYSLYTSSGNDNQLPALMWLDLHMDISLGLPAVILAKLNPNILDNNYILNVPTLTGFTYYMTFGHLEFHWTRLSLVIILSICSLPFTLLSSSVAAANITLSRRC